MGLDLIKVCAGIPMVCGDSNVCEHGLMMIAGLFGLEVKIFGSFERGFQRIKDNCIIFTIPNLHRYQENRMSSPRGYSIFELYNSIPRLIKLLNMQFLLFLLMSDD